MNKLVVGLALALLLSSCVKMVLPEDTKVIPPSQTVPAHVGRYSGSWEGYMGERKYRVVVEEIHPSKVKAVFAWAEQRAPA